MKNGSVIEVMGMLATKFGGLEKFIVELIKNNPSRTFYIIYDEKPKSDIFLNELNKLGAKVLVIDTRGYSFITNTFKFYRLVRNVNPDIVHFHFSFAFCIWGPLCKIMKVKRLYKTVHGCFFSNGKQVFDINDSSIKHRLITQWGNIFKLFDNIFCVSKFVKVQFDQVYRHNGNTSVIYLGTQSPRFLGEDEKLKIKRELGLIDQFVILTVLFANPIKGCDIFIKSLSKIKYQNFIAIIVGMDDKILRTKELKRLAKELGVNSRIRWVGITDEVYKYMNISDVFVQSSRTEALSLAAVEAASYSLPIVATNTGGLPEVTPELFPYEDFNKLAEILDNLIEDKEKRNKLSTISYNRWSKLYRMEDGVKQYTEYYSNNSEC